MNNSKSTTYRQSRDNLSLPVLCVYISSPFIFRIKFIVLNDNNTHNPNNKEDNNMKDTRNVKIFNIIMWTFSIIAMPVIAIPSLIGSLITKKVAEKILEKYHLNTDEII